MCEKTKLSHPDSNDSYLFAFVCRNPCHLYTFLRCFLPYRFENWEIGGAAPENPGEGMDSWIGSDAIDKSLTRKLYGLWLCVWISVYRRVYAIVFSQGIILYKFPIQLYVQFFYIYGVVVSCVFVHVLGKH